MLSNLMFRHICKLETEDLSDGHQTGDSIEFVGEVHGHDSVCTPDPVESTQMHPNKVYGLLVYISCFFSVEFMS